MRPCFTLIDRLPYTLVFFCFLLTTAPCSAAPPRVDLELVMDDGAGIEDSREWIDMLKDLGFSNLRLRSGKNGDRAEIRQVGTDKTPAYSVTGIVTSSHVLRLPGGNFRLGDKGAVRSWKEKLQDGGQEEIHAEKGAYGLTEKQFIELHEQLKGVVAFSTKGEPTQEVIRKIGKQLRLALVDEGKAGSSQEPVLDELQGFSYGTALAAILRPHGCVLVPEKKVGSEIRLMIRDSSGVEKPWPIGWELRVSPSKVAPDYFKTLNAEITDFVLADAMNAIQKRINLPLLYDHNNLLRQRVDIEKVKVTSKKGRRGYSNVVDEILYQAKLKAEIRLDEADKPFLWITTLK